MLRKVQLILLINFLLTFSLANAQQASMLSQNMFSHSFINPGYAAINESICATAFTRQQWVGLTDSEGNHIGPTTYLIAVNTPSAILNGGLGISMSEDKLGFFKDVSVGLKYAYRLELSTGILGIGGQLSVINRNIDFGKFIAIDGNDPVFSGISDNVSSLMADVGLGVYYKVPDQYHLGISVLNLLETKGKSFTEASSGQPILNRTIYLTGGMEYEIPNKPEFRILPSLLIKSDFVSTQISLSSLVQYNNKFWGGVTYNMQTADAIAILLGVQSKNFRIGYSYDLPLSSINPAGSHELMISYCFDIDFNKTKNSYRNTRFL